MLCFPLSPILSLCLSLRREVRLFWIVPAPLKTGACISVSAVPCLHLSPTSPSRNKQSHPEGRRSRWGGRPGWSRRGRRASFQLGATPWCHREPHHRQAGMYNPSVFLRANACLRSSQLGLPAVYRLMVFCFCMTP